MKKLLLALALCLPACGAFAQCNGTFPGGYICGNEPGNPQKPPHAASATTFGVGVGGSNNQIEYNNNGAFGGFTATGDITINPSPSGITTVTHIQTVPITATGASTNDILSYNGTGWIHNALVTLFNSACSVSPTSCAGLFGFNNVKWYGATGNGSTDDTSAIQTALTASCSSGIDLYFPATANSYLVSAINGTNCRDLIVRGNGDKSAIKINGSDADGNWWDLSGSNNIQFNNLKFIDNGTAYRILFLWACTGISCGTSSVLTGLSFDHVNINAKTVLAALYAYGYGCAANCGSDISGGSLNISNSTWQNTNNAGSSIAETRNALLDLTAYNVGSIRSVYVTLTTTTAIAARTHLYNSDFIDAATASGTLSNNAAIVTDGVNQFVMTGGSVQCNCVADFIGWTSDEGLTFLQTAFQDPAPGSSCAVLYWMEFGGGLNGDINLQTPFWSCNGSGGAYIALDQGTGASAGGVQGLTVTSNDPGQNTNGVPFIGKTAAGCGSFTASNNWISNSFLSLIAGANNITTCGSIDSQTIIQRAGTITLPTSATDAGSSNPFR